MIVEPALASINLSNNCMVYYMKSSTIRFSQQMQVISASCNGITACDILLRAPHHCARWTKSPQHRSQRSRCVTCGKARCCSAHLLKLFHVVAAGSVRIQVCAQCRRDRKHCSKHMQRRDLFTWLASKILMHSLSLL